ncbi:MAG: hypothetical protein JO197_15180 [Acidobacteria bacterium]|nr:hypothetical protein [Acidobacteriota bacterium]MBV9475135.1 hypothetical protein [Acidobacteriota bacterium]
MMLAALLFAAAVATPNANAATAAAPPETVFTRFTLKSPGDEAKLVEVVQRAWKTMKRLDVITDTTPLIWRGDGYVLEVITWRSASIPDNAPDEILAQWKEMNALAKVEFVEVWPVSEGSSLPAAVPSK